MQYQKPVIVQQQKMKLSPQMYQSIQMMALPLQELKFRIQEEIEQNPALEIIEDRSTVSIDAERQRESENQEAREYFENSSDPGFSGPLNYEASDNKRKFIEGGTDPSGITPRTPAVAAPASAHLTGRIPNRRTADPEPQRIGISPGKPGKPR